ncbi:hypothetical protein ACUXAV_000677 [Cupriavidus metallidurans]|uniref:hypothetical protein n=1 Tax=Cupriavidus metallidurans TaxID=119219 RepID=UPI000689ACFC|nr:hypothetical protein [Cupriavidus metallidurans]MDE4918578.1 hypothetical protein [Cupriavidus metallidurans]
MAGIDWLRLWHDMPNDPKWRTIARASGKPIALVLSTYVHLLVDASRGVTQCHDESRDMSQEVTNVSRVTRGVTDVTDEDIASALDVSEEDIRTIRVAMQGRVLDGNYLSGWEKRQPRREDAGNPETGAKSAAERKRDQRERERQARDSVAGHDTSRDVTQSHDREEERREESSSTTPNGVVVDSDTAADFTLGKLVQTKPKAARPECPHQEIIALYHEILPMCPSIRGWAGTRQTNLRARWNEDPKRQSLEYWRNFFTYVSQSDFLTGKAKTQEGRKPFLASLDWIVKSENFTKIREERYHGGAA